MSHCILSHFSSFGISLQCLIVFCLISVYLACPCSVSWYLVSFQFLWRVLAVSHCIWSHFSSYGESLQCLHLAFLQCPPTNVHLDLMEAELPHPDLMHRLCFTHSKAEDDRVEEATTITDYTGTTHSTQGNSKQPETSSARTASHEGEHLKIILSQKLNEEPSVDTSGGIHVTTSKDMNKLSSGPGQADKVPSRRKFVAHVNRKQTVVVVDSSKENNRPNKSFEYVSEDQRLTQGNHIKQAHLTDSTHSSVQCTDCDITGQARMSTNNTGTQPSCESYLLLLPLFVLLV